MSRCTGHCCHFIQIAGGDVDVRHVREQAVYYSFFEEAAASFLERIKIADMLVPLVGENPHPTRGPRWLTEADHAYTCRHFDGRNCTNYDGRPRMCRDYPYGKPCLESGCTAENRGVSARDLVKIGVSSSGLR